MGSISRRQEEFANFARSVDRCVAVVDQERDLDKTIAEQVTMANQRNQSTDNGDIVPTLIGLLVDLIVFSGHG